ncbi:MAG: hypothetical protein JW822_03240 [Spirochaetales bacterium]|nr:hypothetical protein [Spirochaetales bacterium]
MKAQVIKIIGLSLLFLLFTSTYCMGMGLGGYISYDLLISTMGWYENWSDFNRVKFLQFGILFDTCVARDRLFNYRLQVGLDLSNASFYDEDLGQDADIDIWQISFINTFGFGMIRNELMRFWVGPQIGFALGFEPNFVQDAYYSNMGEFFEFDIFVGVGFGVNIHIGDTISLCADAGISLHEDFMICPAATFMGYLVKCHVNAGVIIRMDDVYD